MFVDKNPSWNFILLQDEKNLVYAELVLKQSSDDTDAKIPKNTTEYAEIIYKPNADKTKTDPK